MAVSNHTPVCVTLPVICMQGCLSSVAICCVCTKANIAMAICCSSSAVWIDNIVSWAARAPCQHLKAAKGTVLCITAMTCLMIATYNGNAIDKSCFPNISLYGLCGVPLPAESTQLHEQCVLYSCFSMLCLLADLTLLHRRFSPYMLYCLLHAAVCQSL